MNPVLVWLFMIIIINSYFVLLMKSHFLGICIMVYYGRWSLLSGFIICCLLEADDLMDEAVGLWQQKPSLDPNRLSSLIIMS